jgi:ribosomal-protein-alanine N-acetyltransferase
MSRDDAVLADVVLDGTGQTLLGFVISRHAADEGEILTITIEDGNRRQGIGRALFDAHLDRLRASGVNVVYLEVEEGNRPALALYHRLGFLPVGERPGYYRKSDGSRANALILRLKMPR